MSYNILHKQKIMGWLGTYAENDEVVIFIKNEGKGIDPDVIDKLGDPFVTTKINGTGLGLAVCYSIANRHNASIDFQTSQTGTTFYIRFKKIMVEEPSQLG